MVSPMVASAYCLENLLLRESLLSGESLQIAVQGENPHKAGCLPELEDKSWESGEPRGPESSGKIPGEEGV